MKIARILQLNKSLLGGTALLGLGSIAAGALASAELFGGAMAMGALGGVANFAAGMVANNLGALVDKLRDNRDILCDRDLAKAAGRSIGLALEKISTQYPKIEGQLKHLATQAEAYWLQWEAQASQLTLFESVREERLVNIFAQSPEKFSQYQVLQLPEWRELALWLFQQGCEKDALRGKLADYEDIIDTLAGELQQNFNKNLREVLKEDAKHGGEAFASMLLDLHGKTLAKLDGIEQEFKQEFRKLATREDICKALERVESGLLEDVQEMKGMMREIRDIQRLLLRQSRIEQEWELEQSVTDVRSLDLLPTPTYPLPCPYLGLSAFGKNDAHLFFGREDLINELVKAVEGRDAEDGAIIPALEIIPVIGPSGSGKSSVVFAGLIPKLDKSRWLIQSLRPKTHPLHELARALLELTATTETLEVQEENLNTPFVVKQLQDDPSTLEKWLGSLLEKKPQKQILLKRVLEGVKALNRERRQLTLLFTMRADFMENALSEPRLAEVWIGM